MISKRMVVKNREETKGRLCKRAVLANVRLLVPSCRFLYPRSGFLYRHSVFCTLVLVFGVQGTSTKTTTEWVKLLKDLHRVLKNPPPPFLRSQTPPSEAAHLFCSPYSTNLLKNLPSLFKNLPSLLKSFLTRTGSL